MMRHADLPLTSRLFLRGYRWRRAEAVPAARLTKSLSDARVALVSSAGLVSRDDAPFDLHVKGGDTSFRIIADDAHLPDLDIHHRSDAFDRAPLLEDRNVAFPLDRLRELAALGVIAATAPRHLSFMGSITAPGRLRADTAPAAAALLAADGVDVALLVPV